MSSFSSYISNPYFTRLFSASDKPCAIQFWVLSAESKTSNKKVVKNIIYGRVVPYSFANHKWGFSRNDKFQEVEGDRVKVTRLSLFTSSQNTKEFFKHLCDGLTLSEISQQLELTFSDDFNYEFGGLALTPSELIFQPVEYLLNKAAYVQETLSSPHESAGAISAAIGQSNKLSLFSVSSLTNSLLDYIAEKLNEDTGLDFLGKDKARLGDIEFLVFPSLDDMEKVKFAVNHNREKRLISIELAMQKKFQSVKYQFLVKLYNLKKLIYSALQIASYCKESSAYISEFQLNPPTSEIYNCIEVEVYLSNGGDRFTLQDRWRMSYVREISFNMNMVGALHQPVKLDWLERKVESKYTDRMQALLTPNKTVSEVTTLSKREKEPWIALNRQFSKKFELLKPQASKGRFFLRYGPTQGEGSLEFVEWFKDLFESNQNHNIVIFDPYFEALGLSLLKLYASEKGDYTVFTSYPKNENKESGRYSNLLQLCQKNSSRLSSLSLKIYAFKEGKLHDRYILVRNSSGVPVQGFHLSNSLQSATVNQPLLITPIPQDVLLEVTDYMDDLLEQSSGGKSTESERKTLFDSEEVSKKNQNQSTQIDELNEESQLSIMNHDEFINWLGTVKEDSFEEEWPSVALSLAEMSGDSSSQLPKSVLINFLSQLEKFFNEALQQSETVIEESVSITDPSFYAEKLDTLFNLNIDLVLHQPYMKINNLSWAEYYSVKFLWQYKPQFLFDLIVTAGNKNYSKDFEIDASNIKYYTLLSQTLAVMHLSTILFPTEEMAQQLLSKDNAVLQWFGLNMINKLVSQNNNLEVFFTAIQKFSPSQKITFSGWFLLQQKKQANEEVLQKIIARFLQFLPEEFNKQDLKILLDSLRGHMKSLAYNGYWVYTEILEPLVEQKRIAIDELALFWFYDLKQELPLCNRSGSVLFRNVSEGNLTNLSAYFFSFSKANLQENIVAEIVKVQREIADIIHRPLASTINYKKWDSALNTALWLEAFVNLVIFYLQSQGRVNHQLKSIQTELNQITQLRTQAEWQQFSSELVGFYYQIKNMLALQ